MNDLRQQLRSGTIQRAYRALLGYMMDLRAHFKHRHPDYSISGLYQGYLDMTYFAVVPPAFKRRGLKIAIVFNYGAFRFEAWLAAANRQVQRKYYEQLRDTQWSEYRVVAPATGVDSIVECGLAEHIDFASPDDMTATIEKKAGNFIKDMERFFSRHGNKTRG
jgi:hypothetical protein